MKNPRYQGGGSSHVNSFKVTSVWDALTEKENVIYAEGFSSETDVYDEKLAAEAIEAAKQVDKAVVLQDFQNPSSQKDMTANICICRSVRIN